MVPSSSSLQSALAKLVEVLEEENGVLRAHRVVTHAGFTDRKNQALRELMAAQRSEDPRTAALRCQPLIERLSTALKLNTNLLRLHIGAVGEISDIIIGSLREAESDGTYGRNRSSGWR